MKLDVMFSLSRLVTIRFASTLVTLGRRPPSVPARLINNNRAPIKLVNQSKLFCTMADRVVTYEDVVSYKDDPNVLIVDVREPKELHETGKITSSINIPLGELETALNSSSKDSFKSKYGRDFPEKDTQLVFSCKMGGRATKAMNAAIAIGFNNSKVYKGSWDDWASKQ